MTQFTKKQTDGIEALMQARTISVAAKKARVARTTLQRWMKDPEFMAEVRATRGRTYVLTMNGLVAMSCHALDVFDRIFAGEKVPKSQFLAACKVLEYAAGVRGEDLAARLDEIEAKLQSFTEGIEQ